VRVKDPRGVRYQRETRSFPSQAPGARFQRDQSEPLGEGCCSCLAGAIAFSLQ